MNKEQIGKIFFQNKLGEVLSIEKIEIGFSNDIYLINDQLILKVCEDLNNEENFEKEVFFYNFFKDKIPVPKLILFDMAKKIYQRYFMVYEKIEGENLYSRWHLMTDYERKEIIKQLCLILKKINEAHCDDFVTRFKLKPSFNWQGKVVSQIESCLKKVEDKNIISSVFFEEINNFVNKNKNVLKEQKIGLVHSDEHFDNILVKENKIMGILDFERMELASIDFTLNVIKKMVDYPKKYMAEAFEKYAKKEDYSKLLIWFKEFYPELFNFENLEKRLDLYSILHDLKTLYDYPDSVETRQMIEKTIS